MSEFIMVCKCTVFFIFQSEGVKIMQSGIRIEPVWNDTNLVTE